MEEKMNLISITSDFLMTSDEEQDNNIRWFSDLTKRAIEKSSEIEVNCFSSGKYNKNNFDREEFFRLSNIECNIFSKQFFFDPEAISQASINYLKSYFNNNVLLFGYELSEQTRTILNSCKIKFIDAWLHPIRYMDDVLFGLKSNDIAINERLHEFNIPSETYFLYAERLKVQNYRGHRRSKAKLLPNSALFIGQTLTDKAIFSDGKMLTLLDFKSEFERITNLYNHVYYSRHPFVKEGDDLVLDYVSKFKNVSIIDQPSYHLLGSDEIEFVFSISSSVVHEAKYFNKKHKFLFKPVIEIGDEKENYVSVMHEIFYSHFWEAILCPEKIDKNKRKVTYFSEKDKTRDALSFYWGYRNIDKVESLKQTTSILWDKNTKMQKTVKKTINNNKIIESINNYKVISFDIFDTLITRATFSPREVFNYVEDEFNANSETKITNFKQFRILAEEKALQDAISQSNEDCTLDEIYFQLQKIMGITKFVSDKIKLIEIEVEKKLIIPRKRGMEIFNHAVKSGKYVILTSDMYLPKEVIENILQINNISGHKKLYVSSEIKLKKKTGSLFKFISSQLGIEHKDLLHIGDNIDGDIKVPESLNIKAYRTPRAIDNAKFSNPTMKKWVELVASNKTRHLDLIATSIFNNFYDDETTTYNSLFDGSAYKLGYCAFGPLILGFASWIRSQAIEDGVETLYFLSRDSKIIFDCYKILFPNDTIKSSYLYSSRRSVKVPLITNRNEILAEVYKTIFSTTISIWLENTYGLGKENYSEEVLISKGLKGYDHPIGVKFSKELLSEIVLELESKILSNSRTERETLIAYLGSEGLKTESNIAVVDIGYAATMQNAYQRLLDKDNIHGYYFATFNTALKNIKNTKLAKGYCVNYGSPNNSWHTISSHRFIYEALFCDADASLIRPVLSEGGFSFIKSNFEDQVRQQVVNILHDGVKSLAIDVKKIQQSNEFNEYLDPQISGYLFDSFLKSPEYDDIKILSGILFEDSVVPMSKRYIVVPSEHSTNELLLKNMIWKEASTFFKTPSKIDNTLSKNNPEVVKPTALEKNKDNIEKTKKPLLVRVFSRGVIKIEGKLLRLTLNERKSLKYQRNRDQFFVDSKSSILKKYYKLTSHF